MAGPDKWICVGKFGAPHGVQGDVKLQVFTEDPASIQALAPLHGGEGGPTLSLRFGQAWKQGYLVRVAGYDGREAAATLTGTKLYIPRSALPTEEDDEDSFYLADLIGLEARDLEGERLGEVKAVPDFGAGDLLELMLDSPADGLGKTALLPFTKAYVPDIELEKGYVTVDLDRWLKDQMLAKRK